MKEKKKWFEKIFNIRAALFIISILFICVGISLSGYGVDMYTKTAEKYDILNLSYLGQFFSGTVVALFTLSTVILIVLAYLNQREEIFELKEMRSQQETLIQYQQELNKIQAKNIESIERKNKIDRFETTFFKMVELYESTVNNMTITLHQTYSNATGLTERNHGRQAFEKLGREVTGHIGKLRRENTKANKQVLLIDTIKQGYNNFDKYYQHNLGSYHRNLYFILRMINVNEVISQDEKNFYVILIRAQLSRYELLILFYNGLSEYGYKDFKPLLEKYGIFKHLKKDDLVTPQDYDLYDKRAYDLKAPERPMG